MLCIRGFFSKDKTQDLQREYRELGLSAKGSKSTFLKRMNVVKLPTPEVPDPITSQSAEFVDAKVAAPVEPDNDAGMITRKKAALQSSIDDEPSYIDNVRGKHSFCREEIITPCDLPTHARRERGSRTRYSVLTRS